MEKESEQEREQRRKAVAGESKSQYAVKDSDLVTCTLPYNRYEFSSPVLYDGMDAGVLNNEPKHLL